MALMTPHHHMHTHFTRWTPDKDVKHGRHFKMSAFILELHVLCSEQNCERLCKGCLMESKERIVIQMWPFIRYERGCEGVCSRTRSYTLVCLRPLSVLFLEILVCRQSSVKLHNKHYLHVSMLRSCTGAIRGHNLSIRIWAG